MNPELRVLIVDDELAIRQMAARFFGAEGFRCDAAADGIEALDAMNAESYDVVLLDMCVPDVNGHKLAVQLLEEPVRPVIIVATGIQELRLARDLFARGVDDVAHKPCDYRLLAVKAKALATRRRDAAQGDYVKKVQAVADDCDAPAVPAVAHRSSSADLIEFANAICEYAQNLALSIDNP